MDAFGVCMLAKVAINDLLDVHGGGVGEGDLTSLDNGVDRSFMAQRAPSLQGFSPGNPEKAWDRLMAMAGESQKSP